MPDPAPTPAEPKGWLDKFGAALPIALTAIATALAGMSTSELQQAMFWRSAAAQDQAKATNQWSLAGFKRDRSLIVQSTAAVLRAQTGWATPDVPGSGPAAEWLAGKGPPRVALPELPDDALKGLLGAIQRREPESDLLKQAARVPHARVNAAIDEAEKAVERLGGEWDPVVKAATGMVQERAGAAARLKADDTGRGAAVAHATGMQALLFELEQRRYRAEATLNQGVGLLYEARVKVATAESDRHRERSKNFFYAMLAAQVGATISSLALARQRRSVLWLLAGLSGLVAVAIGGYVYIEM